MQTEEGESEGKMAEPKQALIKEIRSHEVAIAELNNLSSSRAVYQKNGNIFFRTTIQKATASEEKQLDLAKAKHEKLESP
ncbi:uncharacterized protein LOC132187195 [Corylus avellana]|uniref:uncharacterized protein LOC132187195 n=1 Tax=Corylus avellana TaxID=13451 RepID=UPI00286D0117|nr:uncharacterized protein LOC132187195 [Corylus avellana]